MRVNGRVGLSGDIAPRTWRLYVESDAGNLRTFTLDEIRALPRTTLVTELKCIEGWSQVISWTGVALRDFMDHYSLGGLYRYVSLTTPDRSYYVGLDRDSATHPQTLLCYEMGGQPLTQAHGAPLRLAIPVKYGIKNIKRIGTIRFTDTRPADYWAERGYDWYAGH
jgi:DMSO/TMAO reductase YedYZ molybdopterin-dependent catalytic subunit